MKQHAYAKAAGKPLRPSSSRFKKPNQEPLSAQRRSGIIPRAHTSLLIAAVIVELQTEFHDQCKLNFHDLNQVANNSSSRSLTATAAGDIPKVDASDLKRGPPSHSAFATEIANPSDPGGSVASKRPCRPAR